MFTGHLFAPSLLLHMWNERSTHAHTLVCERRDKKCLRLFHFRNAKLLSDFFSGYRLLGHLFNEIVFFGVRRPYSGKYQGPSLLVSLATVCPSLA